jgi:hypothetical protein
MPPTPKKQPTPKPQQPPAQPPQPKPKPVDVRNPPDVARADYYQQHYEPYYNSLKPELQKNMLSPKKAIERQLGYAPTWAQDPRQIVNAYKVMKATPKDMSLPDWMKGQEQQIEQAYQWHKFRNGNTPDTDWKLLPGDDPALDFLKSIQGPPDPEAEKESPFTTTDAVRKGQAAWNDIDPEERRTILGDRNFDIAQYPVAVRDQILNDPAFDWSRVPKWQKTYWSIMSNPKIMASPMALAGARAGGMFGIPGKVVGAAAGYGLGLVGGQQYDPTAGVFEQPTTVAGMMAVLNKLSEGAEQTIGYGLQLQYAAVEDKDLARQMIIDPAQRTATWEAGRFAYEAYDFLDARNWMPALARLFGDKDAEFADVNEDFIVGRADPVQRTKLKTFNPATEHLYDEHDKVTASVLDEARQTIHAAILKGEDPKEIVRFLIGENSQFVGSQIADFTGQMLIDPLEKLPNVTTKTTGMLAKLTGHETAARAFAETKAPFEAARRYQTLVQTGDMAPGFDYSQMGSVSRWVAGINEAGQIKAGPLTQTGLLDKPTKRAGIWQKFKEDIAALTPEARAREGATMFYNNIGSLLSTFSDPHEIGQFMRTLSKGDMKLWSEMGNKIAQSPEWYTILPALKDFDGQKVDGLLASWDLAQPKREALLKMADVLGEQPGTFIEDLAKRGTTEQDFQRVTKRLQDSADPGAKELLGQIQRGEFTPDHLKDIVDAFTGDGALHWHPDQWKASLMDALGSHFDEWTVEKLELGKDTPESKAFFRTTHLLKSAQSVLLLGGSPGYALQNGMSNMVHRAATGIYGYMTPRQIDGWLERFGVTPARLEEGVGIGGVVEQATSKSSVKTEKIGKAIKGNQNDALGKAQRWTSAIGKAMPFNKLSSAFESLEGKNGYMIAMRDMWSQTWRRGKGFSEVTPELRSHLERAGINPNQIYNLIEAGMNKGEIERFIFSRQSGIMSRSLVNDAAQKMNIPATSAARLLEKVGVLDELDRGLSKANTPDKVRGAFTRAVQKAQDFQDMQTARDLRAMAESVTNKVQAEGAPAALDVVQRVNGEYFDAWLDHYSRFGEIFADLQEIYDPDLRNRAIEEAYKISDQEFRRVNARTASNYKGIFDAWGESGNPKAMDMLAAIADSDAAMKQAYDFMRETRRKFFDRLRDDPNAPSTWESDQAAIDRAFDKAFATKHQAEVRMGEALADVHTDMHGVAAGEAARQWWEAYVKFSDEIVTREKNFRREQMQARQMGATREQIEAAKQKYYQTEKVAQIAELEHINQEGIQRLERTIRNGGAGSAPTTQPTPDAPSPATTTRTGGEDVFIREPVADETRALIEQAQQRVREQQEAVQAKVTSVWEAAANHGFFGVDDQGNQVPRARYDLLRLVKKYAGNTEEGQYVMSFDDLTPEAVDRALVNRELLQASGAGLLEVTPEDLIGGLDNILARLDNTLKSGSEAQRIKRLQELNTEINSAFQSIPDDVPYEIVRDFIDTQMRLDQELDLLQRDQVVAEASYNNDLTVAEMEARGNATENRLVQEERTGKEKIDLNIDEAARAEEVAYIRQTLDLDSIREKAKRMRAQRNTDSNNTIFQDPYPLGTMENASGFKADSEWQDAGWKQHVRPLLDAMQTVAIDKLTGERSLDGAYKDLSPEGQQQLRQYVRSVQNDMGAVKNSTVKWGESQRDFAMLNYNRRYGFDRYLETVAPYEFYYTRSLMTWGIRALDKPSWYANYARIRNMQNQHERDVPERLRNKFRIPAPWLPDWMGDALYIDPLQNLFTPAGFLRPFETMMRDKNYQVIEAERILQEWAADGTISQDAIAQAAATRSGALWERAAAEAGIRRESEISNPFDFMATLFGPAWYLSTPLNLMGVEVPFLSKGDPNKVTSTPLLNTSRAIEATTKGTWAEPIGQFVGVIGKPEEMLRKKAGLPEFGEFGDYYVDRQLANMVAEGLISSQDAQMAMIERNGELFDQARERVKMELAMRTPLAGAVYAGTHGGAGDAAKSFLPSLFGSGLLPAGELEYRGLKTEWNAAWKQYDAGDKTAINSFFEEHPEYEAYLAKGKEPQERLRSYLVGNIWDQYMALGDTNKKAARAQMGDEFARSFLDKETRSYDSLDVQTLTSWAQMLGALIPRTPETSPVMAVPAGEQPQLDLYDPSVTAVTDKFFTERKDKYSDYFMLEQGYYSLPKSKRAGYLLKFPRLKEYQNWRDGYYKQYPGLKPILQGKVFKTVDTSTWAPGLEQFIVTYAMTGKPLPKGATSALEQVWIREGRPMGDFKSWLNSQVVPAMMYQQPQQ